MPSSLREMPALAGSGQPFVIPEIKDLKAPYTLKWEAGVKIPADGTYTFEVTSSCHTMVFVHDIRLLDENTKPAKDAREASLPLKAGWHPVQVLCRTNVEKPTLSLKIKGPDGKELTLNKDTLKSMNPGW